MAAAGVAAAAGVVAAAAAAAETQMRNIQDGITQTIEDLHLYNCWFVTLARDPGN